MPECKGWRIGESGSQDGEEQGERRVERGEGRSVVNMVYARMYVGETHSCRTWDPTRMSTLHPATVREKGFDSSPDHFWAKRSEMSPWGRKSGPTATSKHV